MDHCIDCALFLLNYCAKLNIKVTGKDPACEKHFELKEINTMFEEDSIKDYDDDGEKIDIDTWDDDTEDWDDPDIDDDDDFDDDDFDDSDLDIKDDDIDFDDDDDWEDDDDC